jgi:serine/threonine protein phosphatase PrpC
VIAKYETIGRRETSEDAHVFGDLRGYSSLTPEQQKTVFDVTFQQMQALYGQCATTGSTAVAVVVTGNKISVSSIGDSAAFVVIRNKKTGKVLQCTCLNALHNADNLHEQARLEKDGKAFIRGRLLGRTIGVICSHAIGDQEVEAAGLIHTSDFTQHTIDTPKDCEAFLVVACDGLTEAASDGKYEEYVKLKFEAFPKDISIEKIPEALGKAAYNDGSGDNITVLCQKIDPESKETQLLAVFDGHGGGQVSAALGKYFLPELQKNVLKKVQESQKA